MDDTKLGVIESRFADLIWAHEPLTSGELVKLCQEELTWKKSTTYTVLKKLCDRGLFRNDGGTVTAAVSREEFHARQSKRFVEETFDGSLPAFLAAFTSRKKLTREEIRQLQKLIDESREG
ncbi:BlaI/MecI/CopY family transcriptional regulator [Dysosmobacter sp.]|jgi:transcriptional repressor, copY family|uniref:BlaI/MecI/CopY family transcriptional regulator n=1 Tax=Dysosmobacter sp. TaxID=2591382 RepID=UPI003FD8573F